MNNILCAIIDLPLFAATNLKQLQLMASATDGSRHTTSPNALRWLLERFIHESEGTATRGLRRRWLSPQNSVMEKNGMTLCV